MDKYIFDESNGLSSFGLCPILYGYRGHFSIEQSRTSLVCPPQQSRHFALIALIGVSFISVPSHQKGQAFIAL